MSHTYIIRQLNLLAQAMWLAAEPAGKDASELVRLAIEVARPGLPPTVEIPPVKITVRREAKAKREVETGFAEFWRQYPRKEGKQPALKAWNRLQGSFDMQKIIAALPAFIACDQWKRDHGLYIPHAATWLNQRRFEELPPTGSKTATKSDARADVANQMFKRGTYAEPGIEIDGTICSRSG
jgi:hypothetical protein